MFCLPGCPTGLGTQAHQGWVGEVSGGVGRMNAYGWVWGVTRCVYSYVHTSVCTTAHVYVWVCRVAVGCVQVRGLVLVHLPFQREGGGQGWRPR